VSTETGSSYTEFNFKWSDLITWQDLIEVLRAASDYEEVSVND
jgi:hypothetical protein